MKIRFQNVKTQFPEYAKDRGLFTRKRRGSLENFTANRYDLIWTINLESDGYHSSEKIMKMKSVIFSQTGRRPPCPPWPARRSPSAPPTPSTIHPTTNSIRWRNSTRSHLPERKLSTVTRTQHATTRGRRLHGRPDGELQYLDSSHQNTN
jgi:hypothetical protein